MPVHKIHRIALFCALAAFTGCRGRPSKAPDVGLAAFESERRGAPRLDVAAYSARLDALAARVNLVAGRTRDPERRIRALNTVLFLEAGFRSVPPGPRPPPETYRLHHLLDTRQGNCFSMPLLYVAVAQRLGWPVHLVHVPDHFFARYVAPGFERGNIEATSGGGFVPDAQYARDFCVSAAGLKSGAYLRTLSHEEVLASLFERDAVDTARRVSTDSAMPLLHQAVRLNPRLVTAWANLAGGHAFLARRRTGAAARRHAELSRRYARMRDRLGFVHPKDVPPALNHRRPAS